MNEIESTETTLELDRLETRALGLVWGLTSSVSKDGGGNVLLSRLATAFGEEYALRTGKLSLLGNTEHEFEFDFEQFSVEDLKTALFHFCALTAGSKKIIKDRQAGFANRSWIVSRLP